MVARDVVQVNLLVEEAEYLYDLLNNEFRHVEALNSVDDQFGKPHRTSDERIAQIRSLRLRMRRAATKGEG